MADKTDNNSQRRSGSWLSSPVIIAIIGAIATVTAAYVGNSGGFTAIFPGSPARTITVTATPSAAQTGSPSALPPATSATSSRYLYTLTPVEDTTNVAINTGSVQFGSTSYQNSIRLDCFAEPQGHQSTIAYNVAGAKFLNATVGIPNNAQSAAGNMMAITFFKNGPADPLGKPVDVSVGQPYALNLNLQGAVQLVISCAAVNSATNNPVSMEYALGNATLTS